MKTKDIIKLHNDKLKKADKVILKAVISTILKVIKKDKKMTEFAMGMGVAGFDYNGYNYGFNYESEDIDKLNKQLGKIDKLLKNVKFELGYALMINEKCEACFEWGSRDKKVVFEKLSTKQIVNRLLYGLKS